MKYSTRHYFIILLFQLYNYTISAQTLVSKPFVGHTSINEINIWCMFKNADSVFIKCSDEQTRLFIYHQELCYKKYLPVNCKFNALQENTSYDIQYSFDKQHFFPLTSAKTSTDSVKDFSFLAGSCAYIGTGFNRVMKPFNSLKIFNYMKKDSAHFMLWLGDNLYYLLQRHNYKAELKRNIKTRLNKKLNAFLYSKQQYAIWDDHDYGTNNSDGTYKYKTASLNIFQQFWPNPKNDTFNYYTFKQQDCQFFMLDDRYNNENENIVLGNKQLTWLEEELLRSDGTFKFICIGMQALNPLSTMECFYKTKNEYNELIRFIKEHHIPGILFISGDRHHGQLMKIEEKGLYPLYDFTTSPLTMYPVNISRRSLEYKNPAEIKGTFFPNYNYGKISIFGGNKNRKCTIELKDKKGKVVWKYEIQAENLK